MKILIADDHDLFREGLNLVLQQLEDGLEVIEAGDFSQAVELAKTTPDISLVLMDLAMPGMRWNDGLDTLSKVLPGTPIVVLSASEDQLLVKEAVNRGAAGYIPKTSSSRVMISALKLVLSGGVYLPPALINHDKNGNHGGDVMHPTATVTTNAANNLLTPRQREVLTLLGEGKSNKEIARILDLSEGTVKLHVTAILRALKVNNRTRAVVAASQMGLSPLNHGSNK